jgi:ATP phosphoribosyltransferase
MSGPLLLAVPSKGRLQENVHAFFARAGLPLVQSRGARDYRGTIAGVPGVEVLYLSASEIAGELGRGAAHFGVTGEDLIRESVPEPDRRVLLLQKLGFGNAKVVVAVPAAWIDVRTMADLDDVAAGVRHRHGRRLRVATKYVNLTRAFFAGHGLGDYRIVESLGATEGAPASGAADAIVDITTSGATLAANGLKVIEDGLILKSEANLVAALGADWTAEARAAAKTVLARIAAAVRASETREVRAALPGDVDAAIAEAAENFGARAPFGKGTPLVLHVKSDAVFPLVELLTARGAETVAVSVLDDLFEARNPLAEALEARLG